MVDAQPIVSTLGVLFIAMLLSMYWQAHNVQSKRATHEVATLSKTEPDVDSPRQEDFQKGVVQVDPEVDLQPGHSPAVVAPPSKGHVQPCLAKRVDPKVHKASNEASPESTLQANLKSTSKLHMQKANLKPTSKLQVEKANLKPTSQQTASGESQSQAHQQIASGESISEVSKSSSQASDHESDGERGLQGLGHSYEEALQKQKKEWKKSFDRYAKDDVITLKQFYVIFDTYLYIDSELNGEAVRENYLTDYGDTTIADLRQNGIDRQRFERTMEKWFDGQSDNWRMIKKDAATGYAISSAVVGFYGDRRIPEGKNYAAAWAAYSKIMQYQIGEVKPGLIDYEQVMAFVAQINEYGEDPAGYLAENNLIHFMDN